MADRTDIDALLIGALYGELTPADEARLTAHLESHPADRTALADLTRTRAAIRDSRIFAFQWEPPHSVSALLLQEASRRAPRPARALDGDSEGWFARFVRAFTAHPAMAAAATLVLVFGVAGSLYLRGSMKMAAPSTVADRAADEPAAGAPVAAAPAAPTRRADRAEEKAEVAAGGGEGSATGAPRAEPTVGGVAAPAEDLDAKPGDIAQFKAKTADVGAKRAALSQPAKASAEDLPRTKARGIELRTPEPSPKDLQEREFDGAAKPDQKLAERQVRERQAPAGGAGASTNAAQPPPPPPPQAPPAASTAFEPTPPQEVANDKRFAQKPLAKGQVLNQAPSNSAPANNASNNAQNAADGKPSDAQSRTLDWARKQREQVVSLVTQNRCDDAANAAIEIYNRAPDYYAANIVTDRQIKPCLAYVNRQRERADRSRNAVKNASDSLSDPAPSRK